MCASGGIARAQVPINRTGSWERDSLGNQRAVVRVTRQAPAVRVMIPWRRRDSLPEAKDIRIFSSAGERVHNIVRLRIERASADLAFEPVAGAGDYYVYYLHYTGTFRSPYPKITYPPPIDSVNQGWLEANQLDSTGVANHAWRRLPMARTVAMEAVDSFNRMDPMELIAAPSEVAALKIAHPGSRFLLFPEDRAFPIRMRDDIPYRWIARGPGGTFRGQASRGEFYAFQIGVFALGDSLSALSSAVSSLRSTTAVIDSTAIRCFNLGGLDWLGRPFRERIDVPRGAVQPLWFGVQVPNDVPPGIYRGAVTVSAANGAAQRVQLELTVTASRLADAGDSEPWRHSRLRWLDSRLADDDSVVPPYTPLRIRGDTIGILGRRLVVGEDGMPESISSQFSIEMTGMADSSRSILANPMALVVSDRGGQALAWSSNRGDIRLIGPGAATWEASSHAGLVNMTVRGRMEFDGYVALDVTLRSSESIDLGNVELAIPYRGNVARYLLGMGQKGGLRPDSLAWKWNVRRNQDGAWLGDVNAGLQFSLRDEHYRRPLNTNFYQSQPLVMPRSWANNGNGACDLRGNGDEAYRVRCGSGPLTLAAGDSLRFDVRLLITPFHPIDTDAQWQTRFYHAFVPLDTVAAHGANVINVHHATEINPWINYPFLRPDTMRAYIAAAHARGMRVKIYYTVRELSDHAAEFFALRSLGGEIFSHGKGGGSAWLQEHLSQDYISAWHVPEIRDAAIVNTGISRWHNYYVEGLNWLARNVGIDGLYIDDVAFDRSIMKRVRKVLVRNRPDPMIDLHSANQFNENDGFASSANLYLEHFPYLDRLWFGEYFDYDSRPDYWLTEISGIPFGLMGEMLQDGGNPWRGMVFGMTARAPWSGDPTPLWHAWDRFGMAGARMIGWWVPSSPVQTGRSDVLATVYSKPGKAMIAVASWAPDTVRVSLAIDWKALGLDSAQAHIRAESIDQFQPSAEFAVGAPISIAPKKGWLLIVE
ncbi:MAG: glycoside hydrolase domain-containing protein [Gemmatimonadota bacterium]